MSENNSMEVLFDVTIANVVVTFLYSETSIYTAETAQPIRQYNKLQQNIQNLK